MFLLRKTNYLVSQSAHCQNNFLFSNLRSFYSVFVLKSSPQLHSRRSQANNVIARRNSASFNNRFGSFQLVMPASFHEPIDVSIMPRRPIPDRLARPYYADDRSSSKWEPIIPIVTPDEVPSLRQAGQLAREILEIGGKMCMPGTTTNQIDAVIHEKIVEKGAYPSPLNYSGFPKSVCTSINNVIAHGIPDDRELQDGDIINIDITVYLNGYHGDTSATFLVGDVDSPGKELVKYTKECLEKAIAICGPGVPFSEIGKVICDHADTGGYSVSEELSGHGIGREFHCLPLIHHHRNFEEGVMVPGMIFTIEPALCQGSPMGMMWPDDWTISTVDNGRSAQFEHMILVTEKGVEILTK